MKKSYLLVALLFAVVTIHAQTLPGGFTQQVYATGFNSLMGFTFDNNGRTFCWEKDGKVYVIINGVRTTLLDITQEAYSVADVGLIGMVLDPHFSNNGYFYLYYIVDPKFLLNTGSQYDDQNNGGSMGRITRYQADITTGFTTVVSNSRTILVGETHSTGIPCTSFFHMGGSMKFAKDGTLIVAVGDGAMAANNDTGNYVYGSQTVSRGIMKAAEHIGSYRAQYLDSHNGKLLRINPSNGNGVSSNPYYAADSPRSPRSRIWAYGIRNPYKILILPETGSHHAEDGDPGTILIGDVGSTLFEELNLCTTPGQNFGWPRYEGESTRTEHPSATWDPGSNNYRKPRFYYNSSTGYSILNGTTYTVGSAQVPGQVSGYCLLLGDFHKKTDIPSSYLNKLFIADYSNKWIKMLTMDSTSQVLKVEDFASNLTDNPIHLDVSPVTSGFFYSTPSQILRIYATTNIPPIAKIEVDTTYGASPLTVQFNAAKSYDPDGSSLTYSWQFDDGSPASAGLKPHHRFDSITSAPAHYKVKLTVTDANGASAFDSLFVHVNNTPPLLLNTSLDTINVIPANQNYNLTLSAAIEDTEHTSGQVSLQWQIYLAHNGHQHLSSSFSGNNINTSLTALECELGLATYWYRIYLTATDAAGLSTTLMKEIYPACGGNTQTITFPFIPDKLTTDASFALTANASSGLPITYHVLSGPAFLTGNQVTLAGQPGTVVLRATQHGNGTYNQANPIERTFEVNRALASQSFTFNSIPDKSVNDAPFNVTASPGTTKFLVISGPATISGDTVTLTGTSGSVTIRAYEAGNYSTDGVYADRTFMVGIPCPVSQEVTSLTYPLYQAQSSLTAGSTTLITPDNQSLVFRAGNSIVIQPSAGTSFSTGVNSTFTIELGGCL